MYKLMSIFGILVLISTFAVAHAQEPDSDELKIRKQIEGWAEAWNRGDAKAIADYYDEDADRTFAHGIVRSGKSQIYELYQKDFSANLPKDVEKKLILKILSVRLITSNVAVADYEYHATGISIAPYLVVDGRSTVVMLKRNGEWLRSAQRNWIPTTPECVKLCQEEVSDYPPKVKK